LAIVDTVNTPVTVKTRIGWDEESKNIVDIAERLQDTGIQAIAIHGRTRAQMYKGIADWTLIGEVKNNPRMTIPVIGNGDIDGPEVAAEMFKRYGVDGIMVGRASVGRPWLFNEIRHYLDTGEVLPEPTMSEKVALARKHLNKSLEYKQGKRGVFEMRRHLSNYFKGLPFFKETRLRLLTTTDTEEISRLFDYIEEKWGNLEDPDKTKGVYGI